METKVCKDCEEQKELNQFYVQKQKRNGKIYEVRSPYCKSCHYERTKTTAREAQLKKNYGITEEEYFEMLNLQNGLCKICLTKGKENRNLSVDHSHKTKRVRGLLCQNCNVGLGKFQDDEKLLAKAIEYLKNNN